MKKSLFLFIALIILFTPLIAFGSYRGYALIDASTERIEPIRVAQTPMGEIHMEANATATDIVTQDTYTKAGGTTTLGHNVCFDMPANNRLRYTCANTRNFHIGVTVVLSNASNGQIANLVVYKNGTVNASNEYTGGTALSNGTIRLTLKTANDLDSSAIHVMSELALNDYIEVAVKNETGATDVTVSEFNLFAMGTADSVN